MRDVFLICRASLLGGFRRDWLRLALYGFVALWAVAGMTVLEGALLYALLGIGMERYYPVVLLAPGVLLSLFSSAYMAGSQLVMTKDFDLIGSLPVSRTSVAVSRVVGAYCVNLLFQLAVYLPGGVLWAVFAHPGWRFYLLYPPMVLCAQMIPLALGSLIGLALSWIRTWFKSTRIFVLLLSMAGMLLYLGAVFSINFENVNWLNLGDQLQLWILRLYPPAGLFQQGMAGESTAAALLFCALGLAAIGAFTVLYACQFQKLHALMTARRAGRRFAMSGQRRSDILGALFLREVRRYFACNVYVFNTGFGLLLSVAMLICLKIRTPEEIFLLMDLPFIAPFVDLLLPLMVALMLGTVCTTGSSLSLEGKNLWILRSLPVSPRQIVLTKVLLNLALGAPFLLLDGLLMLTMFRTDGFGALLLFLTPLSVLVFTALLGILVNLRFCRLDWKSEAEIVKRSLSAGLPVLCAMLLVVGAGALEVVLFIHGRSARWVGWAFPLLMGALDAGLAALLYARSEALMARIRM